MHEGLMFGSKDIKHIYAWELKDNSDVHAVDWNFAQHSRIVMLRKVFDLGFRNILRLYLPHLSALSVDVVLGNNAQYAVSCLSTPAVFPSTSGLQATPM